jgi:hypothetical protein
MTFLAGFIAGSIITFVLAFSYGLYLLHKDDRLAFLRK